MPEPRYTTVDLPITGALRPWVKALVGAEIAGTGPIPLTIGPHDAWMFTVQIGRGADPLDTKAEPGRHVSLTGIRRWRGSFTGGGECVTLFALLTPLGLVQLLRSPALDASPRIRAPVAGLLGERSMRALESSVALQPTLSGRLHALGAWLERRADAPGGQDVAALRAARAATRLAADPMLPIESLARDEGVSRRQLERAFARSLGTSPRHWSSVARLQGLSRRAAAGTPLAEIAADLGYADQSHMSNTVRALSGLPPSRYVRAGAGALGTAFRRATQGGIVYL